MAGEIGDEQSEFLACTTLEARPVHEWLQPCFTWRWEVRTRFANLNHARNASKADAILFIKSNIYLLGDAHLLDAPDSEALSVLALAKAAAPLHLRCTSCSIISFTIRWPDSTFICLSWPDTGVTARASSAARNA